MKKKRSTRLTVNLSDIIIGIICFAGIVYCLSLFWSDINFSYTRTNEKPIAVIYFKKNTAQRKLMNGNIWERLKTESKIYNGDIIRTGAGSEAQTVFNDSSRIDLHENTLVQVFDKIDKGHIEFVKGSISVLASKNEKLKINAGNKVLSFPEEAAAIITISSRNDNQAEITVTSGTVQMEEIIPEDKPAVMKVIEKIGIVTPPQETKTNPVMTISKGDTKEFDTVSYEVSGRTVPFADENQLESAEESVFDEMNVIASVENSTGKIETESSEASGKADIVQKEDDFVNASEFENAVPVLLTPEQNRIFTENDFLVDNAKIAFSWEKVPHAEKYSFVLYDGAGNAVIRKNVSSESYSIKGDSLGLLDNGKYTWEVFANAPLDGTDHSTKKALGAFEIKLESIEDAVVDTDLLIQ